MNTVDKITKEVLNLVNYTKDVSKNSLVKSNQEIGLNDAQLAAVTRLVEGAVEQSYQRFVPAFQKSLNGFLANYQEDKKATKKSK